jgi:hypothetical protein
MRLPLPLPVTQQVGTLSSCQVLKRRRTVAENTPQGRMATCDWPATTNARKHPCNATT